VVTRGRADGLAEVSPLVDALTLDLPADASAPRLARTAIGELVGEDPRREDLLLCVSEVVTNAVLHAGTASQLRVRTNRTRILVEVTDRNPAMPLRRQHDLQAPTGRGLLLLDALTETWGTKPIEGGKIVWFELELGGGHALGATAERTGTRRVELLAVSLAVHRRAAQHAETLRRELALVAHARTPGFAPMRLYELGVELGPVYQGLNAGTDQQLQEALASSAATIDLVYVVPDRAATDLQRLSDLSDELDQYCVDRDLLTLVTPPEALAYRRWWITEMIEQVRDRRPPRPWHDDLVDELAPALEPPAADLAAGSSATTIEVQGDLDLEQAPALRERLVEAIDGGARRIVVDLARCPFLDSTGISLLVTTHLRLEADGGDLRLANLRPGVASVVELAGLSELVM
jgi:anti-anti-sigma factor